MLVKFRMSRYPLTISPEESLSDAHTYMLDQKVRHLPVVKSDDKMIGLIAEDDLLKAQPSSATSLSVWEIHYLLMEVKVKAVMVKNVITTTEDTPIEEAAHLMLDHKIGSLAHIADFPGQGDQPLGSIGGHLAFAGHDAGFSIGRRIVEHKGDESLTGALLQVLEHRLVSGIIGDHHEEIRMGLDHLSFFIDG